LFSDITQPMAVAAQVRESIALLSAVMIPRKRTVPRKIFSVVIIITFCYFGLNCDANVSILFYTSKFLSNFFMRKFAHACKEPKVK